MALNAQTREKFEQYAMEHFPDDVSKRQELIAHLQDCHFHEYVTYIQQQYALARQRQLTEKASNSIDSPASPTQDAEVPHANSDLSPQTRINENGPSVNVSGESVEKLMDAMENVAGTVASQTNSDVIPHSGTQLPRPPNPNLVADESTIDHLSDAIAPNSQSENGDASAPEEEPLRNEQTASPGALIRTPTMWTRSEIDEFKESLADTKDAIVQVGCGEVITIRVPAYPAGSSIVWEFATDSYDIGFGLFFEWASPDSGHQQQQPDFPVDNDKSNASEQASMSPAYPPPLVDEIVPVYRRNSHQEIYCGSHIYPGLGTYLFKFDNSYSLWRSKMLYYRVYYTC
ncbi:Golgi resident protein GCP60 [Clonorchis sinensis]|uniref:Golgi resident protein GCP60 n=1 Tax=Clonorchis sinensis TaxID=79923 RepID=A0A419Q5Y3_CLOSI|nr:Golgi resident protein GCP60 [Clonorchis sinensis]